MKRHRQAAFGEHVFDEIDVDVPRRIERAENDTGCTETAHGRCAFQDRAALRSIVNESVVIRTHDRVHGKRYCSDDRCNSAPRRSEAATLPVAYEFNPRSSRILCSERLLSVGHYHFKLHSRSGSPFGSLGNSKSAVGENAYVLNNFTRYAEALRKNKASPGHPTLLAGRQNFNTTSNILQAPPFQRDTIVLRLAPWKKLRCTRAYYGASISVARLPANDLNDLTDIIYAFGEPGAGNICHAPTSAKYAGGFNETPWATVESRFLTDPSWEQHWSDSAQAPWLYTAGTHTFFSYGDAGSMRIMATHMRLQHLRGMMFWVFGQDDANNSLLHALLRNSRK